MFRAFERACVDRARYLSTRRRAPTRADALDVDTTREFDDDDESTMN